MINCTNRSQILHDKAKQSVEEGKLSEAVKVCIELMQEASTMDNAAAGGAAWGYVVEIVYDLRTLFLNQKLRVDSPGDPLPEIERGALTDSFVTIYNEIRQVLDKGMFGEAYLDPFRRLQIVMSDLTPEQLQVARGYYDMIHKKASYLVEQYVSSSKAKSKD